MYYITMESFGEYLPENWEEIAAQLNKIIDARGIADDLEAVNELWEEYNNQMMDWSAPNEIQ